MTRDEVLAAIASHPRALEFAGDAFARDKGVVLEAVRRDGSALTFASPELRRDADVVLAAVRSNGFSLMDAAGPLRNDPTIVLEAVWTHGYAMVCAPLSLRRDRAFALAAASRNGWSLRYTSFLQDADVVRAAVSSRRRAVVLLPSRTDPRLVRPGYVHLSLLLRRLPLPHDVAVHGVLSHFVDIDKEW